MESYKNAESSEKDINFEHTAESYVDVLFWSFLLSQGNPQLQKIVLDYVVSQVGAFDNDEYQESLKMFADKYFEKDELELSAAMRQFHKPIEGKEQTVERDYDLYRKFDTSTPEKTLRYQLSFLDHPPTVEVESPDLRLFANLLWRQDKKYIAKSEYGGKAKGRPNRSEDMEGSGKLSDKWFSFGVYYLVQKHNVPNVPVIDKLLNEARDVSPIAEYSNGKFKTLRFGDLNDTIESYNLKHKDKKTSVNEITDYFGAIKRDEDRKKMEEKFE